jgi:hypothetical protein
MEMATFAIDLDWWRCPQGYRVARAETHPDEEWIVPNTNERIMYRPLDKNDMVCLVFAKVRTQEGLIEFIKAYGPITRTSTVWGDSIPTCLRWAQRFQELLECKERGPKKVAAAFESQLRASIKRSHEAAGDPLPANYDFNSLDQLIGTAHVIPNPTTGIQVKIVTDVLIGGLWWQLAQKLSGAANIRMCRYCSDAFEAGPGTGKHVDTNFCCDEHKVRYFSLARTKSHNRRKISERRTASHKASGG